MSNFCSIVPQIRNNEGELVDSQLFTDLLSITKDREKTKRIYVSNPDEELSAEDAIGLFSYNSVDLIQEFIIKNKIPKEGRDYRKALPHLKKLRAKFPNNNIKIQTRSDGGYYITYDIPREVSVKAKGGRSYFDTLQEVSEHYEKDINTVLDNILSTSKSDMLKETVQLIKDNYDKVSFLKTTASPSSSNKDAEWAARYYSERGIVEMNTSRFATLSKEEFDHAYVHEIIHAFTVSALNNPKTPAEIEFANTIKKVYDAYKGSKMNNSYGLTDQYEFVAEIMSNPKFVNELAQLKPSLLDKVLSAIRKLLGVTTTHKNKNSEINSIIVAVGSFIINDATPKFTQGELKVLNKNTGVVGQINDYTSNTTRSNKYVNDKEKLLLQIHKKAKFDVSKLNKVIQRLQKDSAKITFTHKGEIQKIIDDYVIYNGGVYDTNYQNIKIYKDAIIKYDSDIEAINAEVADLEVQKAEINSMLLDLSNNNDITINELEYIQLADNHITELENKVYDLDNVEDQRQLAEDYNYLNIIVKNPTHTGLESRSNKLAEKLLIDISDYIANLSNEYLNTSGLSNPNISIKDIKEINDDIITLEKWFTGFGDYPRLEAQLIHAITLDGKQKARLKTIAIGHKTLHHMKELAKWGKANGYTNALGKGSITKVYALLVEVNHLDRLDLVKPFNSLYYQTVSSKFKTLATTKDDAIKTAVKLWLKDNYYNKTTDAQYQNTKYDLIQANFELKEFYDFFKNTVKEGYAQLPDYIQLKNEEKIPSMMKDSFWEFFFLRKENIIKSIWLASKTLLFGHGHVEMYDEAGNPKDKFELEEFNKDNIKIRMIGEIQASNKSLDLGKIIYEFASFTNDYHEMTSVLPKVRMIQNIVETKDYNININAGLTKTTTKGANTNIYKAINMYIDGKIRNDSDQNMLKLPLLGGEIFDNNGEVIGQSNYYMSDFLRQMMKYVRVLYLGFNPFSALSNVSAGLLNDFVEASGGQYFSKRQLGKAIRIYAGASLLNRKNVILGDEDHKSKIALLSDYIQPLQEIGEHQDKRKLDMGASTLVGQGLDSIFNKSFILQEWGEDFVQKITVIAYLLNKKSNGKSHWELFSVNNNNELVWDTQAAGVDYESIVAQERETMKKINRELHGNYSKDNSSVHDGQIIYQVAVLFKKWAPSMIQSRFQAKRYDFAKGDYVEGRFRTVPKAVYNQFHNLFLSINDKLTNQQNYLTNKKDLTKQDIIAAKKTIADVVFFLLFTGLSSVLMPPPDDEDRKDYIPDWMEDLSIWDSEREFNHSDSVMTTLLKSFVENSNKISGEALQMYNLTFYNKLFLSNALIGLGNELNQVVTAYWNLMVLPEDSSKLMITRGVNKGESKAYKETRDIIPVWRQVNKWLKNGTKTLKDIQK